MRPSGLARGAEGRVARPSGRFARQNASNPPMSFRSFVPLAAQKAASLAHRAASPRQNASNPPMPFRSVVPLAAQKAASLAHRAASPRQNAANPLQPSRGVVPLAAQKAASLVKNLNLIQRLKPDTSYRG